MRHKPWPLPTQHTLGTLALSRPSGTEAQLLMIFDAIVRSAAEPTLLGEGDDEDEESGGEQRRRRLQPAKETRRL